MKFAWMMVLIATAWPQPPKWIGSHNRGVSLDLATRSNGVLLCSADDTSFLGFGSNRHREESIPYQEINDNEIHELPAPHDTSVSSDTSETTHKLEVGGPSISMPNLGPIIVNTDGTLRRIENWSQLSKAEQASTMKMVTRRNKKRLDALKELEADGEL